MLNEKRLQAIFIAFRHDSKALAKRSPQKGEHFQATKMTGQFFQLSVSCYNSLLVDLLGCLNLWLVLGIE